jgi:hypothetical protein
VPTLFRVFPYLPAAGASEPGGALFIPPQSAGRLDNPESYRVLYVSGSPSGAIAEAFGRFPEWTPAIFSGSSGLPGSVRALASYRLPDETPICDLDDPRQLLDLGLKPSDVVSRDYTRTRAWAKRIYEQGRWAGVSWWSFYGPQWVSLGLWEAGSLTLEEVHPLHLEDPALIESARTILRKIMPAGKRSQAKRK